MLKREALDAEAVWSLLSYYVTNYYFYCSQARYFEEWCGDDPTFYEDFKDLHARMQEVQRRRTGADEEPDPNFLSEEVEAAQEALAPSL